MRGFLQDTNVTADDLAAQIRKFRDITMGKTTDEKGKKVKVAKNTVVTSRRPTYMILVLPPQKPYHTLCVHTVP